MQPSQNVAYLLLPLLAESRKSEEARLNIRSDKASLLVLPMQIERDLPGRLELLLVGQVFGRFVEPCLLIDSVKLFRVYFYQSQNVLESKRSRRAGRFYGETSDV